MKLSDIDRSTLLAVAFFCVFAAAQGQNKIITRPTQTTTTKPTTNNSGTRTTAPSKKPAQAAEQPTATNTVPAGPSSETITVNGVSFKMIRVEGQGAPYYIGETEVTQALWTAVMGSNPSRFEGDNRPVEMVSWNDCQEFITKLNSLTNRQFRLPNDSEWEYAAKGGNRSQGYEYSGSNNIDEVAWYDSNAGKGVGSSSPDYGTHVVKTKAPNELGLYDMSGNVWEWCQDLYDSSGSNRVSRGGGWFFHASYCRVASRQRVTPTLTISDLGFRLAL